MKCSRRSRSSRESLAGTARSGQGRQAAERTLCRRAPFWHSPTLDERGSGNTFLLVSFEHVFMRRLFSSVLSCAPSGIPYSSSESPRSSFRASQMASARTSLKQLAVFAKIRTTRIRRLIYSLSRSSRFVDFMFLWCCRRIFRDLCAILSSSSQISAERSHNP